ncbi:MAG: hypothetical protein ACI4F7_12225 [Acutalibacteraceae bacterium]
MLKVPRGNSISYSLSLTNADGTPITKEDFPNASVIFTVKKDWRDDTAVAIRKTVPMSQMSDDNVIAIALSSFDTNIEPGTYLYDIAVDAGTEFFTVVYDHQHGYPDKFIVMPTISRK